MAVCEGEEEEEEGGDLDGSSSSSSFSSSFPHVPPSPSSVRDSAFAMEKEENGRGKGRPTRPILQGGKISTSSPLSYKTREKKKKNKNRTRSLTSGVDICCCSCCFFFLGGGT